MIKDSGFFYIFALLSWVLASTLHGHFMFYNEHYMFYNEAAAMEHSEGSRRREDEEGLAHSPSISLPSSLCNTSDYVARTEPHGHT